MLFQVVKILTKSTLSLVPWVIPACKLAAGVHMLNMLQKGVFKSWKFLQEQTPRSSKRSLLQLKSKSPAQFYSSSMQILKPKRTVDFKKKTNLHHQKQWKKTTTITTARTFPRVETERETLPNALNDEDILALVISNSLPCNCLECIEVSETRNNFEPMVFTHSTPMKRNETFEEGANDPRNGSVGDSKIFNSRDRNDGEGNSSSMSYSSDEYILHGPAKTSLSASSGDGCCMLGDCDASPNLGKKVIKPDSIFISSFDEYEGSRDVYETQNEDIGKSSSIQNEEMAVDNMSAGDIAKKAEVHGDGDMNGLERSLSADEYDNIDGRQESDELVKFPEFILRLPKEAVKKDSYNDH